MTGAVHHIKFFIFDWSVPNIIIGAIIVLLQLIPAAILFFSFIGTSTTMGFKKVKKVEEEIILPGAEPVVVKQ